MKKVSKKRNINKKTYSKKNNSYNVVKGNKFSVEQKETIFAEIISEMKKGKMDDFQYQLVFESQKKENMENGLYVDDESIHQHTNVSIVEMLYMKDGAIVDQYVVGNFAFTIFSTSINNSYKGIIVTSVSESDCLFNALEYNPMSFKSLIGNFVKRNESFKLSLHEFKKTFKPNCDVVNSIKGVGYDAFVLKVAV